jgi:hypothetical protein
VLYYTPHPTSVYSYTCKAEIPFLVIGSKSVISDMHDFISQKNYCIKDSFSGEKRCVIQSNMQTKYCSVCLISAMLFIIASL